MSLTTNLREYVAACFTGLWVQSHEHQDALAEIAECGRSEITIGKSMCPGVPRRLHDRTIWIIWIRVIISNFTCFGLVPVESRQY